MQGVRLNLLAALRISQNPVEDFPSALQSIETSKLLRLDPIGFGEFRFEPSSQIMDSALPVDT